MNENIQVQDRDRPLTKGGILTDVGLQDNSLSLSRALQLRHMHNLSMRDKIDNDFPSMD